MRQTLSLQMRQALSLSIGLVAAAGWSLYVFMYTYAHTYVHARVHTHTYRHMNR